MQEADRNPMGRMCTESRLIEAMGHPEFYPEHPSKVQFKQTHMSWVFITDDYVYKVKKPVHFDFADAFTLAERFHFCRQEVRLNRRLAPGIYLDVVPIFDRGKDYVFGDPTDVYRPAVYEYAVKMRRLPEERMLDQQLRGGNVAGETIREVAQKLARFHREASSACAWRYGSATAIQRMVLGNLDECRQFVGYTISKNTFDAIRDYLLGFVTAHRELIDERARRGRVREGHGDLRCEHVCLTPSIDVFDCVEFDEKLRYGDVASDIAFLAMDLDAFGAHHLADELVRSYSSIAEDPDLATLITFYKCHRACVRGKVDSVKSRAEEVDSCDRNNARTRATAKFGLAYSYAKAGRPEVLVVCGLIASGKSTVAEVLRCRTGFEVINSDRVRKHLAGISEATRLPHDYMSGIYDEKFDRLTYGALMNEARRRVEHGRGIILDATFKKAADRNAVLALGAHAGVPVMFVECLCSEEETLRRLNQRSRQNEGTSDATPEIYRLLKRDYAPIREVGARQHLVVDTMKDEGAVFERLEGALRPLFERSELSA